MSQTVEEIKKAGEHLKEVAAETVQLACERGADEAKCVGTASFDARLVVENGEFSLANTTNSKKIGLLVHNKQRKGSTSTNVLGEKTIKPMVEDALALAEFSLPDENLNLPDDRQAPKAPTLDFLLDQVHEANLDVMGHLMKEVLQVFKSEKRFALDRFELSSHTGCHILVNSRGVKQEEYQTTLSWDYLGMARDQDQVSGMDYDGGFSFQLEQPRDQLLAEVREYIAKVVALLNPVKCPSYQGPVLLAPRVISSLLTETWLFHASGRAVMDQKSRWEKSVGKKVVANEISLSDEPHNPLLAGSTAYDSDGLPTKNRKIIDQGILVEHLHDCYSARKMGVTSTAMAGGPFGLCMAPGASTLADMKKGRSELLEVVRFSGNVDPLTGDFSGLAKSSRLISGGQDVGAVGETMIAGNIFDLADQIIAISDIADVVSGSYKAPYVLVDGVTVS